MGKLWLSSEKPNKVIEMKSQLQSTEERRGTEFGGEGKDIVMSNTRPREINWTGQMQILWICCWEDSAWTVLHGGLMEER